MKEVVARPQLVDNIILWNCEDDAVLSHIFHVHISYMNIKIRVYQISGKRRSRLYSVVESPGLMIAHEQRTKSYLESGQISS